MSSNPLDTAVHIYWSKGAVSVYLNTSQISLIIKSSFHCKLKFLENFISLVSKIENDENILNAGKNTNLLTQ